MYRKILVPLDGSARAEAILPHAENLAAQYDADVVLLMVDDKYNLFLERDEVVDLGTYLKKQEEHRESMKAYLRSIIEKWRTRDVRAHIRIGQGPVVKCIVETAIREDADLVAMSSHGQTGEARSFYGSVAVGVLNKIDRPLLLVRSRLRA